MKLSEELRNKKSRDNRELLDRAADRIDELEASLREQSEGEWKDNHCTICGMTPIGEETWTEHNLTPPRFEWCMNFCPNCGAKMKGA